MFVILAPKFNQLHTHPRFPRENVSFTHCVSNNNTIKIIRCKNTFSLIYFFSVLFAYFHYSFIHLHSCIHSLQKNVQIKCSVRRNGYVETTICRHIISLGDNFLQSLCVNKIYLLKSAMKS